MNVTERSILEAMCDSCRRLHARNLLAAADGNFSFRFRNDRIAMTPAGRAKSELRPEHMAWMKLDGSILYGQPSSERRMHLAVYRAVPEARAVLHAHPPTAIAWSLARPGLGFLPDDALPEAILAAGRIPVVPYARPGSEEMGSALVPFLPGHRLMVLARHGAVCWGESVEEVHNGMERLEHVCQILKSAAEMGGAQPLPAEELAALRGMREKLGPTVR